MSARLSDRPVGPRSGCLFVLPWDLHHVGGVNQVIINLWRQLERDGRMRPLLMVIDWACPRPKTETIDGRETIRFRLRDPWPDKGGGKARLSYLASLPVAVLRLARLLREHNISVINVHSVGRHTLLFVLLRWLHLFDGKLVLSFHGADVRDAAKARGLKRMLWRLLFRSADARVTVSAGLRDQLSAIATPAPITVIHNGFDLAEMLAERDRDFCLEPRLTGKPFILTVAAFVPWKGHEVLIEAFTGIADEFPDVLLVLVGGSGPSVDDVRKAIEASGQAHRILVYENVPHRRMSVFYEAASLFVLPSRQEPFGIAVLEAGAFGLPVIASEVGGIPELIRDQETGILVAPGDMSALQAAMVDLLRSPDRTSQLGAALRKRAMQDFSWVRTHDRYMELIR